MLPRLDTYIVFNNFVFGCILGVYFGILSWFPILPLLWTTLLEANPFSQIFLCNYEHFSKDAFLDVKLLGCKILLLLLQIMICIVLSIKVVPIYISTRSVLEDFLESISTLWITIFQNPCQFDSSKWHLLLVQFAKKINFFHICISYFISSILGRWFTDEVQEYIYI